MSGSALICQSFHPSIQSASPTRPSAGSAQASWTLSTRLTTTPPSIDPRLGHLGSWHGRDSTDPTEKKIQFSKTIRGPLEHLALGAMPYLYPSQRHAYWSKSVSYTVYILVQTTARLCRGQVSSAASASAPLQAQALYRQSVRGTPYCASLRTVSLWVIPHPREPKERR